MKKETKEKKNKGFRVKCSKCDWFKKLGDKCHGCSPCLIDWKDRDKKTGELTPYERRLNKI